MIMKFCLNDDKFLYGHPTLCNRLRTLNTRLRSHCLTGDSEAVEEDDGGFPRITAAEFDEAEAEAMRKVLENSRIGKQPKKRTYVAVLLEIDYGNGYMESIPFTLFKDDPDELFERISDMAAYLFRSLYGHRKGTKA